MTAEQFEEARQYRIECKLEMLNKIVGAGIILLPKRLMETIALLRGEVEPIKPYTKLIMKEADHPAYSGFIKKLFRVKFKPMKLYTRMHADGYKSVTVEQVEHLKHANINRDHLNNFVHNTWLKSYIGTIDETSNPN